MAPPPPGESVERRSYAFGDTPVAAARLDVLASVFGPTSRDLLDHLPEPPRHLVLDLGCGPGRTTAMLADAFPAAGVVGIDRSAAFVAEATAAAPGRRCAFVVGDVARPPLPCGPAAVLYARFLLVHLPDPLRVLAGWMGELAPGGLVVVEEPAAIDTADADFRRYLELAAVVVGARGGDLYAGRVLGGVTPPPWATTIVDRRTPLDVGTGAAATIFSMNLETWRDDPAVTAVAGSGETAALLGRLRWTARRRRHGGDPVAYAAARRAAARLTSRAAQHLHLAHPGGGVEDDVGGVSRCVRGARRDGAAVVDTPPSSWPKTWTSPSPLWAVTLSVGPGGSSTSTWPTPTVAVTCTVPGGKTTSRRSTTRLPTASR